MSILIIPVAGVELSLNDTTKGLRWPLKQLYTTWPLSNKKIKDQSNYNDK